jgi:hypothetical protein
MNPPWTTVRTTSKGTDKTWISVNDKNSSSVSVIGMALISPCSDSAKRYFGSKSSSAGRERSSSEHRKRLQRGRWRIYVDGDRHYISHHERTSNVRSGTGPHIASPLYISRKVILPFTVRAIPSVRMI